MNLTVVLSARRPPSSPLSLIVFRAFSTSPTCLQWWHRRHVRGGDFIFALDGLRAADAFEDEGPGEVFRAAAAGVRLQSVLFRGKRLQTVSA